MSREQLARRIESLEGKIIDPAEGPRVLYIYTDAFPSWEAIDRYKAEHPARKYCVVKMVDNKGRVCWDRDPEITGDE